MAMFFGTAATAAPNLAARCTQVPAERDSDAAHAAYKLGKAAFDEGDYTKAANLFREAYARDCTKPQLLAMIARAEDLRGDPGEAVVALEAYLEREPNPPDGDAKRRWLVNLRNKVNERARVAAEARSTPPPKPDPQAVAPQETARPWYPLVGVGVGAVTLIVGGIFHGVGSFKMSNAEDFCPQVGDGICPTPDFHNSPKDTEVPRVRALYDDGRTMAHTVAPILYATGGTLVIGSLVWYFAQPVSSSTHARVRPSLGANQWGFDLGGSF